MNSKHSTCDCQARENKCEQVTFDFSFTDWLREWRELFKPILKRSNVKQQNQSKGELISTQNSKTALSVLTTMVTYLFGPYNSLHDFNLTERKNKISLK